MSHNLRLSSPCHAIKAWRGDRGIAPAILNVGTGRNEWSTLHPDSFTPGNISMFNGKPEFFVYRAFIANTAAMLSSVTAVNAGPGRGESPTLVTPFLNFWVHSYTCVRLLHLSPYWILIRRWNCIGFTPSLNKNVTTLCCSHLVHCCKGTAILSNCFPGSYACRSRANAIYW